MAEPIGRADIPDISDLVFSADGRPVAPQYDADVTVPIPAQFRVSQLDGSDWVGPVDSDRSAGHYEAGRSDEVVTVDGRPAMDELVVELDDALDDEDERGGSVFRAGHRPPATDHPLSA